MVRLSRTDANGTSQSIELPQRVVSQHPQIMGNGAIFPRDEQPLVGGHPARLRLPPAGFTRGRADTNALYANDPDDFRFQDLSSEDRV
jgi:hypothetical protein